MDDKFADNKINISKNKLDDIDSQIYKNKKILKKFDSMQYLLLSLKNNLNKCTELLGKSMKGKKVNSMLIDIKDRNSIYSAKSLNSIDDQKKLYQKKLFGLYNEKDKIVSTMRKENVEDD